MIIGCIADDFTGAGDAASYLAKGGMRTLMFNGVPEDQTDYSETCDAMVIALKTRTEEKESAVQASLKAIRWLQSQGAEQYYFKYCSTFDSTPEGNIGPVADAVMEELGASRAVICPALPDNGRIVVDGCLYVNGVLLDESPMKNHPLTPMWDHRVKNLMEAQSKYACVEVGQDFSGLPGGSGTEPVYIVPDDRNRTDAEKIAAAFGRDLFLTGGSGLLEALAAYRMKYTEKKQTDYPPVIGSTLLLAGSCSEMTRKQIAFYEASGQAAVKINPLELTEKEDRAVAGTEIAGENTALLLYTSDTPENVRKIQTEGKFMIAEKIERFFAEMAVAFYKNGCKKLIVAGGETSGAVMKALGFSKYIIWKSIAPGVPVLIPIEDTGARIVLKSGNFGQEDFFLKAMHMISEGTNDE